MHNVSKNKEAKNVDIINSNLALTYLISSKGSKLFFLSPICLVKKNTYLNHKASQSGA